MKKILSLLLVLTMTMTMSAFAFADGNDLTEEVIEKTITYDEYIQSLANDLGVSIEEAKKIDKEETEKYKKELRKRHPELFEEVVNAQEVVSAEAIVSTLSDDIIYKTISKSKKYNSSFSAFVAANLKIYSSGSFREIIQILGKTYSQRESGWGDYEWNQLNAWDDPDGGEYSTLSVTIGATGTFKTEIDISVSVGSELEGFNIGVSGGTTSTYISEPMQIIYTYNLY